MDVTLIGVGGVPGGVSDADAVGVEITVTVAVGSVGTTVGDGVSEALGTTWPVPPTFPATLGLPTNGPPPQTSAGGYHHHDGQDNHSQQARAQDGYH